MERLKSEKPQYKHGDNIFRTFPIESQQNNEALYDRLVFTGMGENPMISRTGIQVIVLLGLMLAAASLLAQSLDEEQGAGTWGQWAADRHNNETRYGVGLRGRDEVELNKIDESSLLDYSEEKHRSEPPGSEINPSEHRYLERQLLEDLID